MFRNASWRATCDTFQVVLLQRGEREFQVSVTDGKLTHLHPVTDCDLDSAKVQACQHAAQFASRISGGRQTGQEHVVSLEWELILPENVEVKYPINSPEV